MKGIAQQDNPADVLQPPLISSLCFMVSIRNAENGSAILEIGGISWKQELTFDASTSAR
jgi:hypothetical protein